MRLVVLLGVTFFIRVLHLAATLPRVYWKTFFGYHAIVLFSYDLHSQHPVCWAGRFPSITGQSYPGLTTEFSAWLRRSAVSTYLMPYLKIKIKIKIKVKINLNFCPTCLLLEICHSSPGSLRLVISRDSALFSRLTKETAGFRCLSISDGVCRGNFNVVLAHASCQSLLNTVTYIEGIFSEPGVFLC